MATVLDVPTVHEHEGGIAQSDFEDECVTPSRPAVFREAIKDWPAWKAWRPSENGLSYLKDLAGDALVEVMASPVGTAFYGAIGQHERLEVTFGAMVDRAAASVASGSQPCLTAEDDFLPSNSHLYLAQAAMMDSARPGEATLSKLLQDVIVPSFLPADKLVNTNLWMSVCGSRSNAHYDHFHNLLCAVAGSRQVTLWPPSATTSMYPMPLYGEASNHSSVDLEATDHSNFPLFKNACPLSQQVTLRPGDALFIPEGWWHQVNTEGVTLAVNMWWPSAVSLAFEGVGHMASYYARKAVCMLVEQEKARLLRAIKPYPTSHHTLLESPPRTIQHPRNNCRKNKESIVDADTSTSTVQSNIVGESDDTNGSLSPREEELLRVLVLTVADSNQTQCRNHKRNNPHTNPLEKGKDEKNRVEKQGTPDSVEGSLGKLVGATPSTVTLDRSEKKVPKESTKRAEEIYPHANGHKGKQHNGKQSDCVCGEGAGEKDVVASVLAALSPYSLRKVLLSMVNDFPVTLESLILRHVSPMGAEILTLKLEEFDTNPQGDMNTIPVEGGGENRVVDSNARKNGAFVDSRDFFATFYGVFRNPGEALTALLEKKERFGREALNNVMGGVFGVISLEM